jgi:hypothetical protein
MPHERHGRIGRQPLRKAFAAAAGGLAYLPAAAGLAATPERRARISGIALRVAA